MGIEVHVHCAMGLTQLDSIQTLSTGIVLKLLYIFERWAINNLPLGNLQNNLLRGVYFRHLHVRFCSLRTNPGLLYVQHRFLFREKLR